MYRFFLITLVFSCSCNAQSITQSVNSGAIANSSTSIGEIIVSENTSQSSSGIIGILTQLNQTTLEVDQFELSKAVKVYPNPTIAEINFSTELDFSNEIVSVIDTNGKIIFSEKMNNSKKINLEHLSAGIYVIKLQKLSKSFNIIKH